MLFLPILLLVPLISSLSTLFGEIQIDHALLQDAISINSFQRLKFVDQGGPLTYFNLSNSFTRFDHSIGVWALIKLFNGTEEEQLAGLWHDISHTTFSHVADSVFNELSAKEENVLNAFLKNPKKKQLDIGAGNSDEIITVNKENERKIQLSDASEAKACLKDPFPSYQDEIHHWYLNNSDALSIIQKYNIDMSRLSPELYPILEQDLPQMSADRIEYNLFLKNPKKKQLDIGAGNSDEIITVNKENERKIQLSDASEAKACLKDPFPSYQDEIHHWYLNNSDALSIIQKYNIDMSRLSPELYPILEQDLPQMSADRIEYNLHSAYLEKYLDLDDIKKIINDLRFQRKLILSNGKEYENVWFFINQISAKKFGVLPLIFSQTVLGAPYNGVVYKLFSDLIKYCFEKNIIQLEMFHFGTDLEVLEVLRNSKDDVVIETLRKCENIYENFKIASDNEEVDFEIKVKFRGIDPWVLYEGDLLLLSQLDRGFQYHFNQARTLTKKHNIKLIYN